MRYLAGILGLFLSTVAADPGRAETRGAPITFHCSLDARCPEIRIAGDPFATLERTPSPFRGYGDPSLEHEPATGTLWLSYTWLEALPSKGLFPWAPKVDFGASTHLARSDDGGRSFRFVTAVNRTPRTTHPDSGEDGRMMHEVSTLLREPDGRWQILWLAYFDRLGKGPENRSDFHFVRARASRPENLGPGAEPWLGGRAAAAGFRVRHHLSNLPEISDCATLTEPGLFAQDGATYLAAGCIVVEGGRRRPERERVVLLRQTADGYRYLGQLLDFADAERLDAAHLEQADLALSRSGEVILIVTPIRPASDPKHQGCVVYTVDDLARARVRRDNRGHAVPRAVITADGNGLGPGLCTYDAKSETGVMMVITSFDLRSKPVDIVFSLRATGIHP